MTDYTLIDYLSLYDEPRREPVQSQEQTKAVTVREEMLPELSFKVNPAFAGITTISDIPQPHTLPRNYKSFSEEGFLGNDTCYKVISYITQNAGAIPPKLYTDRTLQKEITSHPLLDKLDQPNP